MDKGTTSIIATVATTLLCGFPGVCFCLLGAVTAAGKMPYNYTFGSTSGSGTMPTGYGIVMLCLALILIAIPILVGFFTLRRKPAAPIAPDEPIPPPI